MGRILAVDYGLKRTGLAVTDPLKIIANGLDTVDTAVIFEYFDRYFEKEDVEKVVVGHPKRLNNEEDQIMTYIREFIEDFKKRYPDIPLELYDERYTSKLAVRAMIEGGVKKKKRRNKALIDKVAATILLQEYMNEFL